MSLEFRISVVTSQFAPVEENRGGSNITCDVGWCFTTAYDRKY